MYIPSLHRHLRAAVVVLGPAVPPDDAHESQPGFISLLCQLGLNPFRSCDGTGREEKGVFQRRQFSDNPSKNTNIKIGIIVGILLAAFIAAVATFLYFYGRSIRFTDRRRRRRNGRHKYYSSKSSRSSDGPPPPPPPNSGPPPPGPPPPLAREAPPPKDPPPDE